MATIGEQLQLSRRIGSALHSQRNNLHSAWLRSLRDIPRDFAGKTPEAHLEEFAYPTLDALIAYLDRGDRRATRRLAVSWAMRQDGLGVGLGESVRAILSLGPAIAPLLRRLGLERGQPLVESFLAMFAEELSRTYTTGLKRALSERARAIGAAEERLLSIQMVAGAVAQERDHDLTLDLIARQVVKLTDADTAAVYLPDDDKGILYAAVRIAADGHSADAPSVSIAESTIGHVYRSGHLLAATDTDSAPDDTGRSSILAPLRTRGGVIGVLNVEKAQGGPFSRADIELLGLLADQTAIALENARLFRETTRRNEELSTLYQIGAVASRSLDLDRILTDALDHTLDALALDAGSIYLLDPHGNTLTLHSDCCYLEGDPAAPWPATVPIGEGPIGTVAARGEPLLLDDARPYPQVIASLPLDPGDTLPIAYIGIPLRAKDRVVGVLNILGNPLRDREDQASELALITSIGDQIGVAIDNAQLLSGREERLRQLTTLNDMLRAVAAILDLGSLYDAIYVGCTRLFDTTNFYIALVDPMSGALIPKLRYLSGQRMRNLEGQPINYGLSPLVVAEGRAILTDDYWAECRQRGVQGTPNRAPGPLSWLGVPLTSGGRILGAIVVASERTCYSVEDATLLGAVASGCAVAIENARAYASEQRRVAQLRALNEISGTIVAIREVERLLPLITATVRDRFNYNHVGIMVYDADGDELVLQAQANRGDGPSDLGLRIPVGAHIVGRAAALRQPVLVNDVEQEPHFLRTASLADTRSELAVPIVLGDRLIGILAVESDHVGAFDAGDVATLQTLADNVAVAIENARLFEAERRRQQELTSILDVNTAATSSLVLDEVLKRVARGLSAAVDDLSCGVYLLGENANQLVPRAGVGPDGGPFAGLAAEMRLDLSEEPFLREVIETGHAVVAIDADNDPRINTVLVRALRLKSVLAVPLIARSRALGVAVVAAMRDRYEFSPDQARLAEAIADTAALAVDNARLYAQSRELATAEERNRLAREIHDTIAQGLTAVTYHLEVADELLDDAERIAEAREKIHRGLELTRANLEEARRSVLDLRATALQDQTLPEALNRLLTSASHEHGFEGHFRSQGIEERLPSHLEAGFYRISQELLSNIGKHAHATQVDMTIRRVNGSVTLTVADDGVGFDMNDIRAPGMTGGFGLVGLRERVALLRGVLHIDSAPDEGTSVRVTVPLAEVGSRREPAAVGGEGGNNGGFSEGLAV
jgi:GAF domain-containing protein